MNAERIAAIVWDYCVPRRIPFKFVPGPHLLHLRNTKYAARDTSGKFVTIYPAGEEQLHEVRRELGALLEGLEGPYILTDLRWGDGPLYVRYGAFARAFVVDERGSLVPAVRDGEGRLVPDRRAPSFQVPSGWHCRPSFNRIWRRATPRRSASCRTASRRRCASQRRRRVRGHRHP